MRSRITSNMQQPDLARDPDPTRRGFGMGWATLALLCLATAACATTSAPEVVSAAPGAQLDAVQQRLADVQAISGQPVDSFRYMNPAQFEPIGLSHLLVYTNPQEVWLLRLDGSCRDLDFGPYIKLTEHMHRVATLTDSVIVRDNPIPCIIREIRPVNAALLKRKDQQPHGELDVSGGGH